MISFDEAIALIAANVKPLEAERVSLADAHGRVLAEPVSAAVSSPRCDVSAMDGYALRDADAAVGKSFRVIGKSFAGGKVPPVVGPGETVRIFTGAPLPEGADRVIIQENCKADDGEMQIVNEYGPGWHVRKQGSDFASGSTILPAGTRLGPRAMVALAGADCGEATVYRRPQLSIVATGDELVQPGTAHTRPASMIPESGSFGVAALAAEAGAQVTKRISGADCISTLEQAAGEALAAADIAVVIGGASVGEKDYAKTMFEAHGLELIFAKVAIKPGKPVWLGKAGTKLVFGLPGNPTSAMVTAALLLRPVLARLQGVESGDVQSWRKLPLAAPLPATSSRETFVRAHWGSDGLTPVSNQDSGAQAALVAADWLIRCPADQAEKPAGASTDATPF